MKSDPIIAELVGGPRCGEVIPVRDMQPIRFPVIEPITSYSASDRLDPMSRTAVITYAPVVAYGAYVRNRSLRFVFRYVKSRPLAGLAG